MRMIEIDCECKDGNLNLDVKGAQGNECVEITKQLEEAVGNVDERRNKPEFYQENITDTTKIQKT